MLTPDAFLKNLHVGLDSKMRLSLEGLGFALESLGYAYSQLRELSQAIASENPAELKGFSRIPLFVNVWSIIDSVHSARMILKTFPDQGEAAKSFIEETEVATILRNRMDHIHANLHNLANKVGGPPVFGSLTIHAIDEKHVGQGQSGDPILLGYRAIVIHAGRPVSAMQILARNDGQQIRIEAPAGRFLLEAFDETANLSELTFSAQRLVTHFDETVKLRVEKIVREAAVRAGVDPDAEVKNCGMGMIYQVEVAICDAAAADAAAELGDTD